MWVSVSISIHHQMKVLWWYAKYSSVWLWAKACSGTLSSAVQGTIWGSLLGPGNPSRIKSLGNPKMAPLVEIYTCLLPYPSFFPHLIPPRHPQSSPSPLSLTIFPYFHSSTPPAPKFACQSCLLPISRRITIWFSSGSPSYLASLGSRIIGSKTFNYG